MNADAFIRSMEEAGRKVQQSAAQAMLAAAERAKASLGADGEAITIAPMEPPTKDGQTLHLAEITWPNDDVKRRFEQAYKREMSRK